MTSIEESSIFLRTCIGSIKVLLLLMLRRDEHNIHIPTLGKVDLDIAKQTFTITFDHLPTTIEETIESSRDSA